ncbi:MAG: glycosyltransferase family 2 protein [Bacteroidales bacterium]|nr:glycosyltransferase family 2 protein [Bacteroidales bacterium]
MFKELRRIIFLTFQELKQRGLLFVCKEIIRYLRYGPLQPIEGAGVLDYMRHFKYQYTEDEIENELALLKFKPLISIITPVYNVKPEYLDLCIKSVVNQYYPNWELCLYDDASTNVETLNALKNWMDKDARIKIVFGSVNKHISEASNEAIKMSVGEYIGLLDNDDELHPAALLEVVKSLNENLHADFIYSDEDLIDTDGVCGNPHFKTDLNLELLLSHNYITHFAVIRKSLGDSLAWFRKGFEGSQDHDLFLRITEKTQNIVHISKILYHWRQSENSTALNYSEKSYANLATQKALLEYAHRNNIAVEILPGPGTGAYRFKRKIRTNKMVSIIIPFKDQVKYLKSCVKSVLEKNNYENIEILLVSNNSEKKATLKYLRKIVETDVRIKVLDYNMPFNFSAMNNWAVQQAKGEYVLLLNNDIKVISDNWLEAMLEHIQTDNVGAVGAKLLYKDKTIQHAGVIIGIAGIAGHLHRFLPDSSNGYYYRPTVSQNLSAVTGACLLTKKELWNKVGGLDENHFKIAFNDIDYCLKIRKAGFDIVYTPYAKLYHYESKSRGYEDTPEKKMRFEKECEELRKKWRTHEISDPFYNINLTTNYENFSLK